MDKPCGRGCTLKVHNLATKAAAGLRYAASRALTKIRCANLNLYSLAIIRALENNLTKICKWGNSLGLRLPKEIASAAGLVSGSLVRVRLLDSGALLVTPLAGPVAVATTDVAVKPLTNAAKW